MSEPNGRLGGNMTCDRPLRELTGVPDDREEAEELDSEPWEEDFWLPLATEEENKRSSNSNVSKLITEYPVFFTDDASHKQKGSHFSKVTVGLQLSTWWNTGRKKKPQIHTLIKPPVFCHHLLISRVSSCFLWRYGHRYANEIQWRPWNFYGITIFDRVTLEAYRD